MDKWPTKVPVPASTKGKMGGGGVGAGIGALIFSSIAVWLGMEDLWLTIMPSVGGIIGGALGAYAVRNYITDPRVVELLRDLETQIGRGRSSIRSSWIATVGALALASLMLAGCGGVKIDGTINDTERDILDGAKVLAITTLVSLNEAGVDPLQVPENKLKLVRMGCDIVAGGATIVRQGNPDIGAEISDFCEIFIAAAGSAE